MKPIHRDATLLDRNPLVVARNCGRLRSLDEGRLPYRKAAGVSTVLRYCTLKNCWGSVQRPSTLNPAGSCQLSKLLQRVLIGTLCPDALAQFESNLDLSNTNRLVHKAHQMHLDPTLPRIIEGIVPKLVELEVSTQFLVHALKQVQVEPRRYPLSIIIGAMQDIEVLLQIYPDQQTTPCACPGNLLEKAFRWLAVKVANGRAGKIGNFPGNRLCWRRAR